MSKQGVFSDPRDIRWTWLGKGEERGTSDRVYYKAAKVVRLSDKLERTFKVGDTVYVNAGSKEPWVAHLVEMFERGSSEIDDDEVQVVDDTNSSNNSMRCTLRWFYMKDDVDEESFRMARGIPRRVRGEVYFSDHVENSGSNGLEVIEGRAFLCSTEQEMRNLKDNPPKNYWDDDAVRLVRCFYGNKSGNPPPLRELEKGELQHLLSKPSTDTHLYRRSRPALYGVTGAVMKGTGSKKHSLAGSNSVRGSVADGSPRLTTRKSSARSSREEPVFDDDMGETPVDVAIPRKKKKNRAGSSSKAPRRDDEGGIDDVPIRRRAQSAKPRHRRVIEFDSSDDESEEIVQVPSSRVRPTPRRVIETIEQSGRVPSARPKQSKKVSQREEPRAQKSKVSTMEVDSGKKDVANGASDATWDNFRNALKSGSPDGAAFLMANMKDMLTAMTTTMAEKNLDFDMTAAEKKAVARHVAKQFFGNGQLQASSGGTSTSAPNGSAANRSSGSHP